MKHPDQESQEENLGLLVLALARIFTDNGNRTDLNDFIAELGLADNIH